MGGHSKKAHSGDKCSHNNNENCEHCQEKRHFRKVRTYHGPSTEHYDHVIIKSV